MRKQGAILNGSDVVIFQYLNPRHLRFYNCANNFACKQSIKHLLFFVSFPYIMFDTEINEVNESFVKQLFELFYIYFFIISTRTFNAQRIMCVRVCVYIYIFFISCSRIPQYI